MHITGTQSALTGNLSVFQILTRSLLPQKTIVFSYSFIPQILIPFSCIPFSDQHGEHTCAANTETGGDSDGQIHHHLSGPRPSGSCELTLEKKEQFSMQVRHPSRGMRLFWLTWDGGGEKKTRWNHCLSGLTDDRKSCHLLNLEKCSGPQSCGRFAK